MEKRKKRKEMMDEMTRQLILQASQEILIKEGLEGFTMERVAQQTGVAKGTLYLHFKDKVRLLEETIKKGFEPIFQQAGEVFNSDLSPKEKLQEFSLLTSLFFERNQQLITTVLYFPQIEKIFRGGENTPHWMLVGKVAQVLEDGIRQGIFKPMNAILVAGMFLDAQGALARHYFLGLNTNTAQENAKLVTDVFLNGISV